VFGTLHTNTAPSTVDRIIDQFPTDRQAQIRVMLSESLRGVVSQTLCKKIGGGRIACLEILVVNAAISNLIREAKTFQIPSIMQTGKAIGMQTQTDAMLELVRGNKVTPLEAYTKAVDQGLMKSTLERNGYRIDAK
jgi:twitching motility protein PilT